MTREKQSFNLDLFLELNEEYKDKPVVPRPRRTGKVDLEGAAKRRAANIDKSLNVRDKRVLEIGCGRGAFSYVLARDYACDVVGVDIVEREWSDYKSVPNLDLRVLDVSSEDHEDIGQFDLIYSSAVWEHIKHPYAALQGVKRLLRNDGHFFLSANLYRGPQASHRYREVFFPWPHLLFTDDVFEAFYLHTGRKPNRPAWVNKLTYSGYRHYFEILGFEVQKEWFSCSQFDEGFYNRFEDVLSRYSKTDLERDFLNATVVHGSLVESEHVSETSTRSQTGKLESEVREPRKTILDLELEIEAANERVGKVERQLREERNKVRDMQNSMRWQVGTLLANSAHRPWRLARLPFDLLRLATDRDRRKNAPRKAAG